MTTELELLSQWGWMTSAGPSLSFTPVGEGEVECSFGTYYYKLVMSNPISDPANPVYLYDLYFQPHCHNVDTYKYISFDRVKINDVYKTYDEIHDIIKSNLLAIGKSLVKVSEK